jgi:hypothetical protein
MQMQFLSYQNYHNGAVSKHLTGVGMGKTVHVGGDSESLDTVCYKGGAPQSIQNDRPVSQFFLLGPPPPHPQGSVGSKGGTHSLAGGGGGPNSDEGTYLVLYVYYNPSTGCTMPCICQSLIVFLHKPAMHLL